MVGENKPEKVNGYCALCWSSCGCVSTVDNGRIIAVEPDPEHPTGDSLCAKGLAAPDMVNSGDRLLYPMKRTHPKGNADPGWKRITWDEALDTVASEMQRLACESGPESVAFGITTTAGTSMQDGFNWVLRLRNAYGTPNAVISYEVCTYHHQIINLHTYGTPMPVGDYANSDCIIVWGHNATKTWLAHGRRITAGQRKGASLIVIDPRLDGIAVKADEWVPVRPGTDTALALGLAHEIIRAKLYDAPFLRSWTNAPFLIEKSTGKFLAPPGVEGEAKYMAMDIRTGETVVYDPQTRTYDGNTADLALMGVFEVNGVICEPVFQKYTNACTAFTPEHVEMLTDIPSEQIRRLALIIGRAKRVSFTSGAGVEQHTNATQTSRAIAVLYAMTGCFDSEGGNVIFETAPVNSIAGAEMLDQDQLEKALGGKDRPLGPESFGFITSENFYDAVLTEKPYPVRGLLNFGPNLVLSHANGIRGATALQKLEFMVNADMLITPTAHYADILLPVNTPWEREVLLTNFVVDQRASSHIQLRPAAIESIGESRSDAWIVCELGKRLGFNDIFWNGDMDAAHAYILKPSGVKLADLKANPRGITLGLETQYRKYEKDGGFATPSGKIELLSQRFLELSYPALPEYLPPQPAVSDKEEGAYPLVLTSAKTAQFLHSQMRGIARLRRIEPYPFAEIHPSAAAKRGVSEGDWIEIRSPAGRIRMKARLTDKISPGVVSATHGWWQPCDILGAPGYDPQTPGGSNVNLLIGEGHFDPITGSVPLKSFVCDFSLVSRKSDLGDSV